MPNSYFNFKQFSINQDKCSMKVCTDSCVLGTWAATKINSDAKNILDIGTGTGLLSLMLAQKTNAIIDAVEIDADAAFQANENFQQSPWKERLNVIISSVQDFKALKKYDFIISNPPFFEDDLKSGHVLKNMAKHNTTLSLKELVIAINNNLETNGYCAILLPFHRTEYFENMAAVNQFFVNEKLLIRQSAEHDYFRSILLVSKNKTAVKESELIIHEAERQYTEEFKELLKYYYLNF